MELSETGRRIVERPKYPLPVVDRQRHYESSQFQRSLRRQVNAGRTTWPHVRFAAHGSLPPVAQLLRRRTG